MKNLSDETVHMRVLRSGYVYSGRGNCNHLTQLLAKLCSKYAAAGHSVEHQISGNVGST